MRRKHVLVTGCAGFLGSHLAQHYLDAGCTVYGIDDFSSSSKESLHLKKLLSISEFNLIEANICEDHKRWWPAGASLDLILNFACPASPPVYQSIPVHTMLTCTAGVANMLELASAHHACVVHASTSEVYGEPLVSPQKETLRSHVNSYGPRSCYDAGKMSAEALCYDFRVSHGVDARLVRIHNTFGPHMDPYDGRVVSNFIQQVLQGKKMTIYGDGSQTRSLCYVDDMVSGIVSVASLKENPGSPVNLGSDDEVTMIQLAKQVVYAVKAFGGGNPDMVDLKHWATFEPLPVDDPTRRCPDTTLARELMGWKIVVPLSDGIRRTAAYFKQVLNR